MEQILENETVRALLAEDGTLLIGVAGEEKAQSSEILTELKSCTAGEPNAYCCYARPEEVEEAHEMGLSYGKYRAWQKLKSLGADVTAEEVKNLSMREIRRRIRELSGEAKEEEASKGKGRGNILCQKSGDKKWR